MRRGIPVHMQALVYTHHAQSRAAMREERAGHTLTPHLGHQRQEGIHHVLPESRHLGEFGYALGRIRGERIDDLRLESVSALAFTLHIG